MDLGISDKTAVVTGGGGRIGSADCEILADEGADVYCLDVDLEGAESVAADLDDRDGNVEPIECDLTDRDGVASTIEAIREESGGVDILVNNAAAVDARSKLENYDDDLWDRDVAVNLTGTYNITREVFPAMCERGWGRVVNMTSIAGWLGGFGQASYSATKSALIGFGKTLALEGAQSGVTANIVAPSLAASELADLELEEIEAMDEHMHRIVEMIPMRRAGREEDVANLVAYLSSEQANYVTGQLVGVTGGADLFAF
ncbi:SDR family NAD(P)-dependent oxidoreductase [Halococcus thailandensis]|uniref:Short-chain dehydrogenase/reductase SDR n=1 Tax=Halococcus thailandensis JCM 13552 TaxID=1227457 RepID=M0MYZ5_9EURY|nr:SDR family NAD(P)-dependent oxidoreductase [Halococcus thailandensis]EMA49630.1 short-chain dehydrogenase/reductase SDR [Halococcus thailandensis JCM 13552]